jgi:NAD(P)-dependent dehydrogenase (short-subunit alcohol dehydrogenase family)
LRNRNIWNRREKKTMTRSKKEKTSSETKGQLRTYRDAVVIVTGGASGIGRAIAEALGEKGARAIILLDRQTAASAEVTKALQAKQTKAEVKAYEVDVRNFTDVERVVKETKETYGRIDYVFNNAGVVVGGTIEQIGIEGFNYVLDVNLCGIVNGVLAAYPIMKEQGFGHIINTASILGLIPVGERWTAYGASKYAIVGLSTNLRIEAARHGVYVSALCPCIIRTPIFRGGEYGRLPDGIEKVFEKSHPMDPKVFATKALKKIAKNKSIIVFPVWPYKIVWFLHRLWPSLGLYLARKQSDKIGAKLEKFADQRKDEPTKTEQELVGS